MTVLEVERIKGGKEVGSGIFAGVLTIKAGKATVIDPLVGAPRVDSLTLDEYASTNHPDIYRGTCLENRKVLLPWWIWKEISKRKSWKGGETNCVQQINTGSV